MCCLFNGLIIKEEEQRFWSPKGKFWTPGSIYARATTLRTLWSHLATGNLSICRELSWLIDYEYTALITRKQKQNDRTPKEKATNAGYYIFNVNSWYLLLTSKPHWSWQESNPNLYNTHCIYRVLNRFLSRRWSLIK